MAQRMARGFVARTTRRVADAARSLDYRWRTLTEHLRFMRCPAVHALPDIFHYWSNRYLRPKLEFFGATHPEAFFLQYIERCRLQNAEGPHRFLSIGAGDCAIEVGLARALARNGAPPFVIECLDVNNAILERGRRLAFAEGVSAHIVTVATDLNRWRPQGSYDAVLANHSLHHIVGLENLFDGVARSLSPKGLFIVSDMIGRNGHMRWPEALVIVEELWNELPKSYRFDRQRDLQERRFRNHDCSTAGFEGIRAQDILPLLVDRFAFDAFVGFANVIDPFVDRSFGPNFSVDRDWDREFIDRVHARDEAALGRGEITPTHMLAVMCVGREGENQYTDGRSPRQSVRRPD
jgi:SAM-dependent methyltransferase